MAAVKATAARWAKQIRSVLFDFPMCGVTIRTIFHAHIPTVEHCKAIAH